MLNSDVRVKLSSQNTDFLYSSTLDSLKLCYFCSQLFLYLFYICARAKSFQPCPTLATLCTISHQAPLSMGFSRQEYWSGLPFLLPGDLPDPGIEPVSPELAGGFFSLSCQVSSVHFSSVQFSRSVVSDSLRPHES